MARHSQINLVVAHSLEAKPLCALLGLRASKNNKAFPVYTNDRGVSLIVSGMGKLAAASATAYLAGSQSDAPTSAWLNVGIAGHGRSAVGEGLLANKISDAATAKSYYPPQLYSGFQSTAVITVDAVERNYAEPVAYEMEAYGFYTMANKVATAELVQVFKVISDNPESPAERFDLKRVQGLIENQGPRITLLIEAMLSLLEKYRAAYDAPESYTSLVQSYHLSATQRSQLLRLCERYTALEREGELSNLIAQQYSSSRLLIEALRSGIRQGFEQ